MNSSLSITKKINAFMTEHKYQQLALSNTVFNYLLCGSGKQTLIFLDGGMGSSAAWFQYIQYFEQSYQVLTFSFPHNLPTNLAQVNAIKMLMDKLAIEQASFVAVSYGTLLAQLFSKKNPAYVDKLVLLSGGGLTKETKASLKKYKLLFRLSVLGAQVLPFTMVKKNIIKSSIKNLTNQNNSNEQKEIIKETISRLYQNCSKETTINMGYLLLDIFDTENCKKADFAYLDQRSLLILPQKDFFPREAQEALIQLMTNPEMIWIDKGAHGDPMFKEEYMEAIQLFLQKN